MRDKERTFHKVSRSITSTLAFMLCTTLFRITSSIRNRKYKRERRRRTNLNYLKNYIHGEETTLKLSSKLFSPELWKSQGTYRQKGAPGSVYGATRQITTRVSMVHPRKRGHTGTARAAPSGTRCRLVPLLVVAPGFWIWASGFDRTTFQSQ